MVCFRGILSKPEVNEQLVRPRWVPLCWELGSKSLVSFGYEWVQAKAQKGSRYDGGCPNRRRSHTRLCNMAVAEGQAPSSSNYRSARLGRTEITRPGPLGMGEARHLLVALTNALRS